MARILYGVHGTGHGHAMRALAVARHYPQHEFRFVSHSHGAALLRHEHAVVECYNPETPVAAHRVTSTAALGSALRTFRRQPHLTRLLLQEIEQFKPDVALTDYEYFVPRASRAAGLPCLSFDHQHIVTCAHHRMPAYQYVSYAATFAAIRGLFSHASEYLVTSFYRPPLRHGACARLVPPILREQALQHRPSDGGHVLAYHGYSTSKGFFDFLRAIPRPVKLYGSNLVRDDGNLQFKANSEEEFLADLAGSSYVVCGAGHTLISEALYFGKPLFVLPIRGAFEQFLNAHYVQQLGYGRYHAGLTPPARLVPEFEAGLDGFRANIRAANFLGNPEIFDALDTFIATGALPLCAS
jgi:uncharacterized protein (TIGR00661 family)